MTLSKEELREIIANAKASLEQYLAMELLERREWDRQEPFGFTDGERHGMCYEPRHADRLRDPQPLYRASPPAPVVPDEIVGWVRVDYQSDDSKSYVPLFVLGSNDPSEVWGVKYEPLIACRAAMHGTTISNSVDIAIDEASQSFGNSEQLPEPVLICDMCGHDAWHQGGRTYMCGEGHVFEVRAPKSEPVSQPYKLVGEVVKWDHPTKERTVDFRWIDIDVPPGTKLYAVNLPVIPDGWISVCDQMPDQKSERRVCVFTPTPHEDMRYRFVPASLFKAVCSSATHWYYIEPPAAPKQESE